LSSAASDRVDDLGAAGPSPDDPVERVVEGVRVEDRGMAQQVVFVAVVVVVDGVEIPVRAVGEDRGDPGFR
jgi:hypothetical protein